ncbi:MAG: stage 0 sporulation protein [Nitrospirae bacterium]|nr:stage 0 sporulation protein [Nitrospirota bacterium]
MPTVVGIRFKKCGKIYDFEIDGLTVKVGDFVVVESSFGLTIGNIVIGEKTIEAADKELKKVIRSVTEEDINAKVSNDLLEQETREYCTERIAIRGLPMKLVHTEVTLDRRRIVFYFTADGRIDFRELVKDLASRFKTRIEMRQIGVRDETKLIGGIGICGREVCCRTFLSNFAPISIRMAKKQDLVLNPGKLSGLCGRLMCCLGFEVEDFHSECVPEDAIIIKEDVALEDLIGEAKNEFSINTAEERHSRSKFGDSREDAKSPGITGGEATDPTLENGTGALKNRDRRKKHFTKRHSPAAPLIETKEAVEAKAVPQEPANPEANPDAPKDTPADAKAEPTGKKNKWRFRKFKAKKKP